MVINCDIEFDNNPHGVYFSGQKLTGRFTLSVNKVKKIKAVVLKVLGCASTQWTEIDKSSEIITYHDQRLYLDTNTYLLQAADKSEIITIEPGIHTYNFTCRIPNNCPSSFEGAYGHIRYVIKVVVLRPWKRNQTFNKAFTVLKVLDLNYETPLVKMPINLTSEKSHLCNCIKVQPLKIDLHLPRSSFVCGQQIPIEMSLNHQGNVPVGEIQLCLMMLVDYIAQYPNKKLRNERIVITKLRDNFEAKPNLRTFNYLLPIVATPPSCLYTACKLIQISYVLEVEIKIKGLQKNQLLQAPLTIGTVPLPNVIQQQPYATEIRDITILPWLSNHGMPQPEYVEANHILKVKVGEDEAQKYEVLEEFSPKYPVFIHFKNSLEAGSNEEMNSKTLVDNKSTWL
ncbi:arrestin domain-containing protein 2-like [Glossina fuscipes fuscipes]